MFRPGLIAVIGLCCCVSTSPQTSGLEKMPWKALDGLPTADFKAEPDSTSIHLATSATGISMKEMASRPHMKELSIVANFYPQESWIRQGVSVAVLQHENRHFCIVELHARQLRKKLSQLPSLEESNAKEVVHQAYRSAVDSCKAMEESYNLTTSYGRLMQEEAAWQQRLSQRLAEMEVWSSPRVVIALE